MRRAKALSMIFVLVFSIFSIINFSAPVKAQELVCCEQTRDGENCVYTDRENCDSGKGIVETTCDKTSFCRLGCCYDESEGDCNKNVGVASCEASNGTWDSSAECDIQQCEEGCCIIGEEGSFVTLTKCKIITADFPDAEMDFDDTITNEVDCINKARGKDKGACVSEDGKCVFTTRDECSTTGTTNVNTTGPKVGFWKDYLCSNSRLGTDCAAMQDTGCYNEDIYWFDSCGNKENIYKSSDGRKDGYNDGFVLSEENSCSINGAYDTTCGNCDYSAGTICGEKPRSVNMEYGEFSCVDLNCPNVYDNDASPDSGGNKQHGESWCIYDAAVGFGSDVVGSRHYKHLCINNVELTEECKDYREEFCIEGVVGEEPTEDLGTALTTTGEFTEAACRENRFTDCDSCNNINDCGGDCDEFEGDAKIACCAAECCSDITNKDCFFAGTEAGLGECVPHVPPGLKFWESEGESKSTCNKANLQCEVKWKESGMHRIGLGGDEECVQNCHCLEEDWIIAANSVCIAQGDCGAWYNVAGELTFDGFSETHDGELTSSDLVSWKTVSRYSGEGRKFEFKMWQETWNDLKAGLVVASISGITAVALFKGGGVFKIFGAGVTSGVPAFQALFGESLAGSIEEHFGEFTAKEVGFETFKFFSIINAIMWIYTIYSLLDTFLTDTKSRTINSVCSPWVAPDGGSDCEQCNEDWKTCSEYRCKSLGKNCLLVNPGTGNETCINNNPYDTTSPIIKPNPSALTEELTLTENPLDATPGFKINERIAAFTPISLGITTDEPSQCKFALNASIKYDDMPFEFGDSLVIYNHTLLFALPSELTTEEAFSLTNNGAYTLYTKCKDASGNANERDYYIKFQIDPSPDLTAPTIELTDLINGQYIAANINETDFNIYLNEPANCNWNKNDTRYSSMSNSFGCVTNGFEITGLYYGLYKCNTKLLNITQNVDNDYYIKCQDLSDNKNTMSESYKFTLKGSVPLLIKSIEPTGTIEDNTTTLKVITDKGVLNSTCGYTDNTADKENIANMIVMFGNNGNTHTQELTNLAAGTKTYYLGCIDGAGNIALNSTSFTIIEPTVPELLNLYKDTANNLLHVETNKDTTCQYNIDEDFDWGRGTSMTNPDDTAHDANLELGKIYYIKCRDKFEKELSFVSYT